MAWRTPMDVKVAALVATRIDVERTGIGIVAGVIDDGSGRRGAVA